MSERDGNGHSKIQEHVARAVLCRRCNTELDPQDVYVLGRREAYWCVAVSCPRCMHQGVLFLRTSDENDRTDVVELTDEELARYDDLPPISQSDVASLRSALHEFRNDISELWEEE